jgi:thiamine-phosphate pyrophosphorylase
MSPKPILCYITDRTQFRGNESARRERLLEKIAEAAEAGIDYIQLREKDLHARDLENLAREVIRIWRGVTLRTENREPGTENRQLRTGVLINSRTDIALAVGADGVHLPAGDILPTEVRRIFQYSCVADTRVRLTISQSCHSPEEVRQSALNGADLALFAPVFEKKGAPTTRPTGLEALRLACQSQIPVLALGGISLENASACLDAGAAGIAAIRLFQQNPIADIVRELRRP